MTPEEQLPDGVKETRDENKKSTKKWLKRFGVLGFWFFFAKGMVWIAVAVATYYGFSGC